jgi:hypothetical protein
MTASQSAKAAGLKSLTEVEQMTGKPCQTLRNWYRDERRLFDAVIRGCAAIKADKAHA